MASPRKTQLLLRLIMSRRSLLFQCTDDDLGMTDKTDELRVRCIQEVLTALGFQHALDVDTTCGDYWTEPFTESHLYKTASVFYDFVRAMPLFRESPKLPKAWTRKEATQVIDSVLGAVGLKLKGSSVQKQENGTRSRTYEYKLDEQRVEEMREFLALKLRTEPMWANGSGGLRLDPVALHKSMRAQKIVHHAHLLHRRPKPLMPHASDADEKSDSNASECE